MSYGSPDWEDWVLDEEKSLPLLEHAYKVGLNTWDTVRSPFLATPFVRFHSTYNFSVVVHYSSET